MANSFYYGLVLSIFTSLTLQAGEADRFKYGRDWVYQPMIVNGKTIFSGMAESGKLAEERYQAMKPIFNRYETRPMKVLDIGANNGYFSFRIAEEYPKSHCVMFDCSSRLGDLCMANTQLNNITCFEGHFRSKDISEMRARETFDVILALFVLHHVDNWKHWLTELKKMCKYLILEIPPEDDEINKQSHTRALTHHILNNEKYTLLGRCQRKNKHDYIVVIEGSISGSNHLGIKPSSFVRFNGIFPNPQYISARTQMNDKYQIIGTQIK